MFPRDSEASKETISVVNCMKNLMVLIVFERNKYKSFLMDCTVAPKSSIRMVSDRKLQTCS